MNKPVLNPPQHVAVLSKRSHNELGKTANLPMKPLITILTCLLLLSCSKNPVSIDTTYNCPIQLSYSSADSVEARDLALWAEAKLVPSDSAVTEMLCSINYLRYRFRDSTSFQSFLGQRFCLPWMPTQIAIKFDSVTADSVRKNIYTGWSLLPAEAKFTSVIPPDVLLWSVVRYSQRRNPWRLCEFYAKLPGVVVCEPDFVSVPFGSFPIFVGIREGRMSYVFVEDYIYMPYWRHYFYYENQEPKYAGRWSYQQIPPPTWVQDAKATIDSFSRWGKYK